MFLIVAGIGLALIVARQNQKVLREEASRIKKELEQLEADKRASERLEAMGKLAGGVAHEIRNPLNTVEMVAQRLSLEFEPKSDNEEYLGLVNTMRGEAKRIGKIVQDFLDFAKPPKANKRKSSLNELIDKIKTTFTPLAESKEIEFSINHRAKKELNIDSEQLYQAVFNLLRNAYEATPNGSGKIQISTYENKFNTTIEVNDNGPGIPEEDRIRVFHLYYTTKAEGTGIGLSLVHRIVDEHEGRVEISESPSGGASIKLILKRT